MLGKLHFVSSCVRPGIMFVSRLLIWLRSLPDDKEYYNIPLFVKKDLIWWSKFLNIFNGVSMMSIDEWSHPDEILESDACLGGCEGWFLDRRESGIRCLFRWLWRLVPGQERIWNQMPV